MATYQVTITQTDRESSTDKIVHEGNDWKVALANFRGAVDRSQGEWSNYDFIGQSVKLLDHGRPVRNYVGSKDPAYSVALHGPGGANTKLRQALGR